MPGALGAWALPWPNTASALNGFVLVGSPAPVPVTMTTAAAKPGAAAEICFPQALSVPVLPGPCLGSAHGSGALDPTPEEERGLASWLDRSGSDTLGRPQGFPTHVPPVGKDEEESPSC